MVTAAKTLPRDLHIGIAPLGSPFALDVGFSLDSIKEKVDDGYLDNVGKSRRFLRQRHEVSPPVELPFKFDFAAGR
jgi:hypothetical protein